MEENQLTFECRGRVDVLDKIDPDLIGFLNQTSNQRNALNETDVNPQQVEGYQITPAARLIENLIGEQAPKGTLAKVHIVFSEGSVEFLAVVSILYSAAEVAATVGGTIQLIQIMQRLVDQSVRTGVRITIETAQPGITISATQATINLVNGVGIGVGGNSGTPSTTNAMLASMNARLMRLEMGAIFLAIFIVALSVIFIVAERARFSPATVETGVEQLNRPNFRDPISNPPLVPLEGEWLVTQSPGFRTCTSETIGTASPDETAEINIVGNRMLISWEKEHREFIGVGGHYRGSFTEHIGNAYNTTVYRFQVISNHMIVGEIEYIWDNFDASFQDCVSIYPFELVYVS